MKQSVYEFDPEGDAALVLETARLGFLWADDVLRIGVKPRTRIEPQVKPEPPVYTQALVKLPILEKPFQIPADYYDDPPCDETPEPLEADSSEDSDDESTTGYNINAGDEVIERFEQNGYMPSPRPSTAVSVADSSVNESIDELFGESSNPSSSRVRVRMRVSSSHLALASPVFRRILATSYKESSGSSLRQIRASRWDPDALIIILDIMHGHYRSVPKAITIDMFAKIAIIVDYYECHEVVELFIDIWLKAMEAEIPTSYGKACILWLLVSWVFSRADIFGSMAGLASRHSKSLIVAMDLPLPGIILDRINEQRQNALTRIFDPIYRLLANLRNSSDCSFECSSILLGSLMKEMSRGGILDPPIIRPFYGYSISATKRLVSSFKSPQWSHHIKGRYGAHKAPHSCSLTEKIEPIIEKMQSQLQAVKLEDFSHPTVQGWARCK